MKNALSEKIKNNFDANMVNSISKMLYDADQLKDSQDDINVLIKCAHELLKNRDSTFIKLMKDANTIL